MGDQVIIRQITLKFKNGEELRFYREGDDIIVGKGSKEYSLTKEEIIDFVQELLGLIK